ncbi:MAG TPA: substrate-binding domain-containing protein [Mucilaginibacter sp.]|jgi:ABC-type phosphate transport system substrate-binding protein|nr:substrate-binding domain-containing protein [Mucilaginibacter sp.]
MKNSSLSFLLLTALCLAACNGSRGQSGRDTAQIKSFGNNSNSNILLGAGSSLAYPLFSKLFAEYAKETHVMVNYQSVGSGGGILQLTNKTVDFGDSDTPLANGQIKKMTAPILQITLFHRTNLTGSGRNAENEFNRTLIYKEQSYDGRSLQRAQKLLKFLWWMIHDGQKYCSDASYAPLSPVEVATNEKLLKSATFERKPILQ